MNDVAITITRPQKVNDHWSLKWFLDHYYFYYYYLYYYYYYYLYYYYYVHVIVYYTLVDRLKDVLYTIKGTEYYQMVRVTIHQTCARKVIM